MRGPLLHPTAATRTAMLRGFTAWVAARDADRDDPDPSRDADLIQICDRMVAIRAEQVARCEVVK